MKIVVLKGSPRPNGNFGRTDGGRVLVNGIWASGVPFKEPNLWIWLTVMAKN